jgi:hypothetical protein
MHVVAEASYENVFESDQNSLFDSLLQDKTVYVVPPAGKLLGPRLGVLEWLDENLNGQPPDKPVRIPNNWIRTEPRSLEAPFK